MSTTDTAGTARGEMAMDDETTRLRALLQLSPALPWTAEHDEENDVLMIETAPRGAEPVMCVEAVRRHRGVDLIVAAVNALPGLCDTIDALRADLRDARADLDAQSFLRPHPSKRTGIRCARCGRDGGVDVGDDMPVCGWCADAVTVECERDEATERAERAERERDDLAATLEAIIAGRMTPPTDTDVVAHGARGGAWLIQGGRWVTPSVQVFTVASSRDWYADRGVVRWWPLDRDGRPCAWPTAEVSRG